MLRKIIDFFRPDGPKLGAYVFFWLCVLSALFWEKSQHKGEVVICMIKGCDSVWPILTGKGHPLLELIGALLFIPAGILMVFLVELGKLLGVPLGFRGVSQFPEFLYFLILLFVLNWFPFCIFWKIIGVFVESCEKTVSSSEHSE
jgi:hypothetical protein